MTAGNSSPLSDGAAGVIVMEAGLAARLGLTPIARFVGFNVAGVPPEIMGIGPVAAVPRVLQRTGLSLADLDLIELNEAFAAQSLAVMRALDLNPDVVNVNGGGDRAGAPAGLHRGQADRATAARATAARRALWHGHHVHWRRAGRSGHLRESREWGVGSSCLALTHPVTLSIYT
ncbi:MAG: hypothetical protein KatS3mg051_1101 [Anaerolineae bacterium]|nr:MAG: hypothetical protein KatS3mg051_1101 [Anaerolineae bacterium]